jgi:hypothetical protein
MYSKKKKTKPLPNPTDPEKTAKDLKNQKIKVVEKIFEGEKPLKNNNNKKKKSKY